MIFRRFAYGFLATLALYVPGVALCDEVLQPPPEKPPEELRPAYILKLAESITWNLPSEQKNFNLCLLGEVEEELEIKSLKPGYVLKPQQPNVELRLKVLRPEADDTKTLTSVCNEVYIGFSEEARLTSILQKLSHRPVLTISSIKRFASQGGMFGLTITDGFNEKGESVKKLRFVVNRDAINEAGLKVRAATLELGLKEDPE